MRDRFFGFFAITFMVCTWIVLLFHTDKGPPHGWLLAVSIIALLAFGGLLVIYERWPRAQGSRSSDGTTGSSGYIHDGATSASSFSSSSSSSSCSSSHDSSSCSSY